MARLARVVVPGLPHHVTQRGNRRQPVFFGADDYRSYLRVLRDQSQRWGLEVWAYCLMTNHVHLIVVPQTAQSLVRTLSETHRRYTRRINFREDWRGYLWQGRFASYPLDERHLLAAVRYVERNPVRAGMVLRAEDYPWSSARAHVNAVYDELLHPCFLSDQIRDWAAFLTAPDDQACSKRLERHARTGRPYGEKDFLDRLERQLGRCLRPRKRGPKPARETLAPTVAGV